jgi:predicted regulator of Ras-like GTPase activity (Roadblock/LC7/MglB family)
MKEILEELKGSMGGIIGSFIVSENGVVLAQDVPNLMTEPLNKVSKTLHHVTNVIKATRSVDRLTVDSENAKLISIPADSRILGVVTEKTVNQPLLKLMSNMAVSKIKEAQTIPAEPAAKTSEFDVEKICDLYDKLFAVPSKRLSNLIGPKSAIHFKEGTEDVRKSLQGLFDGISFDNTGKPDIDKIKENAGNITNKDEFNDALDEMLLSMLDVLKKIAGAKQEQRAMDEIQRIKSEVE